MKRLLVLICGLSLLAGCNRDDGGGGISPDGVTVLFSAGGLGIETAQAADGVHTRASVPLSEGTTMRVVAFKRAVSGSYADLTGIPKYINSYVAASDGSLTPTLVDSYGSIATGTASQMRIAENGVYDFYAYADALPFTAGTSNVSGITHGMDFLAGAATNVAINVGGNTPVTVAFSDMEHLCTKIDLTVKPDMRDGSLMTPVDPLIVPNTSLTSLVVNSVTMSGVATGPATFNVGSAGVVPASPAGGTYTMPAASFANSDVKTSSGGGIMLPSTPAAAGIDIAFSVTINGTPVALKATGIKAIAQFLKGCRYPFTLLIGETRLHLILTVSNNGSLPLWDELDWNSSMGGGTSIVLGSWDVVSWTSSMGDGGTTLSVGNWTPCSWNSAMGNGSVFTVQSWMNLGWFSEMGE